MNTEIAQKKSFEEKMKDRIKESIGDLIDDEKLTELVEQGIKSAFLEPRPVYSKSTFSRGQIDRHDPPYIEEMLKEFLAERMDAAIIAWCNKNSDKLIKHLKQTLERAPAEAFLASLGKVFEARVSNLHAEMMDDLINMLRGQGMNI